MRINESLGIQKEVGDISERSAKIILDRIKKYKDDIIDGREYSFTCYCQTSEEERKTTKIEYVKFYLNFVNKKDFKCSGSFMPSKTMLLDNEYYEAAVSLRFESNIENFDVGFFSGVLSHELNHSFVYLKQLKNGTNKSKSHILNFANKLTMGKMIKEMEENDSLKEFCKMIYFSLPAEINARVQETGEHLKNINHKNYNDTISHLMQFNPLNDAKKMINYKVDNLNDVNEIVKEKFINVFNETLGGLGFSKKIKENSFFEYWQKNINNKGKVLFRKIMKLVADKYNINENLMVVETKYYKIYKESGKSIFYSEFIDACEI
jgi:hypothetical protein